MLDQTDLQIIEMLTENSRMQLKDIGQKVHMTGQAVASRIQKLQDAGIIEGFTIRVNMEKIGKPLNAYIIVFMKSNTHAEFMAFLQKKDIVLEAYRIIGYGCFLLRVNIASQAELSKLLDEILPYGNYSVSTCMTRVK